MSGILSLTPSENDDYNQFTRAIYKKDFDVKRPRGRPPKRWCDQIKQDTNLPLLTSEKSYQDEEKWRQIIKENVARLSGVSN